MAGYIRLPRDSAEQDRLLIGDDLYSVSTYARPSQTQHRIDGFCRFFTLTLSLTMVIISALDITFKQRGCQPMLFVLTTACFALIVNLAHLLYTPLIFNLLRALKTAQCSNSEIDKYRRRAVWTARAIDGTISLLLFIASIIAFVFAALIYPPGLRVASGLIGLFTSFFMSHHAFGVLNKFTRMRVHVTFVDTRAESPAQSTRASSVQGPELRDNTMSMINPIPAESTTEAQQQEQDSPTDSKA